MLTEEFLAPRRCLSEPIPEVLEAAKLLDAAVASYMAGDRAAAGDLMRQADMEVLSAWRHRVIGLVMKEPGLDVFSVGLRLCARCPR